MQEQKVEAEETYCPLRGNWVIGVSWPRYNQLCPEDVNRSQDLHRTCDGPHIFISLNMDLGFPKTTTTTTKNTPLFSFSVMLDKCVLCDQATPSVVQTVNTRTTIVTTLQKSALHSVKDMSSLVIHVHHCSAFPIHRSLDTHSRLLANLSHFREHYLIPS